MPAPWRSTSGIWQTGPAPVVQPLVVLLAHLLKWEHLPDRRGGSWRRTFREHRHYRAQLRSGTLRNHALAVLAQAYAEARNQAADESDLDVGVFPVENPWTLDTALSGPEA